MSIRGLNLPTHLPMGNKPVAGELLNHMNAQINGLRQALSASHQSSALGNLPIGKPDLIIGVAEIVSIVSKSSYKASFRYLDPKDGTWKNSTIQLPVDASIYNSVAGDAEPRYNVGDKIAVLYDPRSFLFVPLHSPPDQNASITVFSETLTAVPRGGTSSIASNNGTHIALERLRGGSGAPDIFAPDLAIRPETSRGIISASVPIVAEVADGDVFRLRCGTGHSTRAIMNVRSAGISIRWLGRVSTDSYSYEKLAKYDTEDFVTIPDLLPTSVISSRYNDVPQANFTFSTDGTIQFSIPGITKSKWLAEFTVWAAVEQTNLWAFAKIKAAEGDSPGQSSATFVEPNEDGFHDAVILNGYDDGALADFSELDQKIWLVFIDRFGSGTKKIVAECGVVYGPVVYTGQEGSADGPADEEGNTTSDRRPIYATTIIKEEYIGTYDGDLKRGESAEFKILNSDFQPNSPEIKIDAICKANPYKRDTYATITRVNGIMLANQLACAKTSPNQAQ